MTCFAITRLWWRVKNEGFVWFIHRRGILHRDPTPSYIMKFGWHDISLRLSPNDTTLIDTLSLDDLSLDNIPDPLSCLYTILHFAALLRRSAVICLAWCHIHGVTVAYGHVGGACALLGAVLSCYQPSSPSASPDWLCCSLRLWYSSPSASQNLDTLAARTGFPNSLGRSISRPSNHISSLSSANPGHSSSVCFIICPL